MEERHETENLDRRAALKRIFVGLGGLAMAGGLVSGCEDVPGYYYDSYGGYYSYSGSNSYYGSYMSYYFVEGPVSYYGSYGSYGGGDGSTTVEHPGW